jgi:hypothetical protein
MLAPEATREPAVVHGRTVLASFTAGAMVGSLPCILGHSIEILRRQA